MPAPADRLPRKGKGKLTLQCPATLLELLREHHKKQAAERLRAGSSCADHDLVFATCRGGPITGTEDWRSWKAILRQAQVRDARAHDARHTADTLLIEQAVHIPVVQEVLGHTRVTTTERYTVRHLAAALLTAYNPHTTGAGFAGIDLLIVAAWGVGGLVIALWKFSWVPLSR